MSYKSDEKSLENASTSQTETFKDPEKRARLYFEKHQLTGVFQDIAEKIARERPEDPRSFMLDLILVSMKKGASEAQNEEPLDHKTEDQVSFSIAKKPSKSSLGTNESDQEAGISSI